MVDVRLVWDKEGGEVALAGEFNSWTAQKAEKTAAGWEVVLNLKPGRYEYKWVVDGNWVTDPDKPLQADQSGNQNNILEVEEDSEGSGDSDSWERVSVGDCATEDRSKGSSSPELVEAAGEEPNNNTVKSSQKIERLFSPGAEFFTVISASGEKLESCEYPVMYWDSPEYTLMKQGVWLKQYLDKWMLRKLDKAGVQTEEDRGKVEETLSHILHRKVTLESESLNATLKKSIQFQGEKSRWNVDGLEVEYVREGDLKTVTIRTEGSLGEGLERVYATANLLKLNRFNLV